MCKLYIDLDNFVSKVPHTYSDFFSCVRLWLKIIFCGHVHTPRIVCLARISFGFLLRPLIIDYNKEDDSVKDNNMVSQCKVSWVRLSSNLSSLTYKCKFSQMREILWISVPNLNKNDNYYLAFSSYHVPGSVLSTLKIISYNPHTYL